MSANVHGGATPAGGVVMEQVNASTGSGTIQQQGVASEPIIITRRINVKIQGSMSDFAQVSLIWPHSMLPTPTQQFDGTYTQTHTHRMGREGHHGALWTGSRPPSGGSRTSSHPVGAPPAPQPVQPMAPPHMPSATPSSRVRSSSSTSQPTRSPLGLPSAASHPMRSPPSGRHTATRSSPRVSTRSLSSSLRHPMRARRYPPPLHLPSCTGCHHHAWLPPPCGVIFDPHTTGQQVEEGLPQVQCNQPREAWGPRDHGLLLRLCS